MPKTDFDQMGKNLANENLLATNSFNEFRTSLNNRIYECQLSVLRTRFLVKILREKTLLKTLSWMKEELNHILNELTIESLISSKFILNQFEKFELDGTISKLEKAKRTKNTDDLQKMLGVILSEVMVSASKEKFQSNVNKMARFQRDWQVALNQLEERMLS